jgi:hypothetical protein
VPIVLPPKQGQIAMKEVKAKIFRNKSFRRRNEMNRFNPAHLIGHSQVLSVFPA